MINVLIADDHPIVREGLKQIIAETEDIVIKGEASDGTEVYFHSDSVLDNAFDRIHPGSKVAFDAEPALVGLQAVEVRLIDN